MEKSASTVSSLLMPYYLNLLKHVSGAELYSCVNLKIKSIFKLFPHTEFFDSGSECDASRTIQDLQ